MEHIIQVKDDNQSHNIGHNEGDGTYAVKTADLVARDRLAKITPAESIGDGRKTVATAGSRERLVDQSTECKWVIITAETDNTGFVVAGGSTVVAAQDTRRGAPLGAGDSIQIICNDLYDIYLDTTVNGDGVTFIYGR